jgi:hypothetical protein
MEAAAGIETPNARKTWGRRRADMDSCSPAKPMQTTARSKTCWRADVDSRGPAKPMKTSAASKAGRDRRSDVGNSRAVKVMKIAAAKAAVESPARKTWGEGRNAGVEVRRGGNAAGAQATRG